MNPFNKYEAIGVFVSIAIMAVTLSVIRFKTDIFAMSALNGDTQGAVVAVSQKEEGDLDLESKLKDSFSLNGELQELVVDDVRIGSGEEAKKGDVLTVHYVGTTQDGIKFDSSYDRGEPFVFTVGEGEAIAGWEAGLIGMKEGGQRILVIPSDMAYGNRQVGPIPPNSSLVFSIELLKIK